MKTYIIGHLEHQEDVKQFETIEQAIKEQAHWQIIEANSLEEAKKKLLQ